MSKVWQNLTKKKIKNAKKLSWTCTRKTRKFIKKISNFFVELKKKIHQKKTHIVGTKCLIEMMYYDVIWGKSLGWTTYFILSAYFITWLVCDQTSKRQIHDIFIQALSLVS